MDPIEICKYIARDLGVVTKDDSSGVCGRFGRCHFTVTDKGWTIRKVRRKSSGTSPTMFLLMLHKKNGHDEMTAIDAAMLVSDIAKHLGEKAAV